jgi:hypothetical protein
VSRTKKNVAGGCTGDVGMKQIKIKPGGFERPSPERLLQNRSRCTSVSGVPENQGVPHRRDACATI